MDIKEIYELRRSFSLIALTGKTGSGCTKFSEIISQPINFSDTKMLRTPEMITYEKGNEKNDEYLNNVTLFKRKYTICYNYIHKNKNNIKYKTISYIDSIMFYVLHYIIHELEIKEPSDVKIKVENLIKQNYTKSKRKNRDFDYIDINQNVICDQIPPIPQALINKISVVSKDILEITDTAQFHSLFKAFFNDGFKNWVNNYYNVLGGYDYYLGSFFVHRLGNKIRATGNPFETNEKLSQQADPSNIYTLAKLINKLIKSYRNKHPNSCHICIDSLRNSLEIMFFKERYSAFYMVAIHNEGRHYKRLKNRVKKAQDRIGFNDNPNSIDKTTQKIVDFDRIERGTSDFKKGIFFAPDVENCIQKSEIHINNPGKNFLTDTPERKTKFFTMIEQWIRIKSLISQPGIVTPTHEERCMQIAYNSKFNSGCISRQVGAVITDTNNSIRSVGWNDVPKGAIPCNIRDLNDIIKPELVDDLHDRSYSEFELSEEDKQYKYGGNFSKNTKQLFGKHVKKTNNLGLNHSFCFKSLHNRYELKDNQVHTRSLHAEENAML